MAKLSTNGRKKMNGIVKLNAVVKKLQKSLVLRKGLSSNFNNEYVPEDVQEGHFAVIAMYKGESRRFVVPLRFLTHPTFVSLLEKAAEEYGFDCDGVLAIPCCPSDFERILAELEEGNELGWGF